MTTKFSKKAFWFVLFTLFACFTVVFCQDHAIQPELRSENLKPIVSRIRNEYHLPGMALGIITPDTIIVAVAGVKDVLTEKEIELSDRFHIGSCTKAMTAFVAARLIEKGLIKWENTILDIFPDWEPGIKVHYWNKTVGDLLSHRAGIKPFFMGLNSKLYRKMSSRVAKRNKECDSPNGYWGKIQFLTNKKNTYIPMRAIRWPLPALKR